MAERWLKSVDEAISSFGGRRETGAEGCKSVARLLCPAERATDFEGWHRGYIGETCKVRTADTPPKVLGAMLGHSGVVTQQLRDTCAAVANVREAVAILESPQCELVLNRRCLDVSKVSYILRCNGDRVETEALSDFDAALRGATEDAIRGKLRDEGWIQATLGVDAGGLGLKEACVIALPAFIASRVASRPLVEEMYLHAETEGIGTVAQCMAAYDARTLPAAEKWAAWLPQGVHGEALRTVEAAAAAAVRRWRCWCEGEEEEPEESAVPPAARGSRRPGVAVVPDAGAEDPEHPAAMGGSGSPKLQRELTRLADACVAQGLLQRARASGDWEQEQRLRELSSEDCSHEWLWAISKHKGKVLSPDDFALANRIRLGAGGPGSDVICANCGECILGVAGTHGLLCSRGPSTRGHNAVRDEIFAYAHSIDPSTEVEPTGLVGSRPALRPADVLTGVPDPSGRLAALDVGIISPAAQGAGADCVQSMVDRKNARIGPYRRELEDIGVEYRPVAFSCFGRPHGDAVRILQAMAKQHARRKGTEMHTEMRRLMSKITTEIWRRAARMVRQCTPEMDEGEEDGEVVDGITLARIGHPGTAELAPLMPRG